MVDHVPQTIEISLTEYALIRKEDLRDAVETLEACAYDAGQADGLGEAIERRLADLQEARDRVQRMIGTGAG